MNAIDIVFPGPAACDAPLRGRDLLAAILNEPPAVEYQPIKNARTLETVAYEALARFSAGGRSLPPNRVFAALHDNPLLFHYAEMKWKRLQIEEASRTARLFVNLDPDAWAHGLCIDGADSYMDLFAPLRDWLVVEIIENIHLHDVERAQRLSNACKAASLRVALDDVSASQGVVSFAALAEAHYMKFDRSWLFRGENDAEAAVRHSLLEYALSLSRRFPLTTVLEGVETADHLALARHFGFDYVQGFLFRDQFVRRVGDRRAPHTP
jgi:EAL domain-containing protein (putative c-di-GMP-specific phosphodiesterase class I)